MEDILSILSELNEAAVEWIVSESYEDALDCLLKAEYIITVLFPTVQKSKLCNINNKAQL